MSTQRKTPSFKQHKPSSKRDSKTLSRVGKGDTECERKLRSCLWHKGLRFRKNVSKLPGKPDIVFPKAKLAIFCDGDFWHGKNWQTRKRKLERGSNSDYWVAKIEANIQRDKKQDRHLRERGWRVLRYWESDILAEVEEITNEIAEHVREGSG